MNIALKRISLVAVVALVTCMVPMARGASAGASLEDEQYGAPMTQDRGEMVFQIDPNFADDFHDNISVLTAVDSTGEKFCTSTSEGVCATASEYQFSAVLGPCSAAVTVDCIESVSGTSANGTASNGVFKQQFPIRGITDYTGSPSEGVPSGGTPSLWTLDGVPHGYGNDYEVAVQISGSKVNGDALKPPRSFSAVITPVSIFQTDCNPLTSGAQCRDKWVEDVLPNGRTAKNFWSDSYDEHMGYLCRSWNGDQKCTLQHAFPVGARFTVKVRLSASPSGWLHGRLQDPTASIVRANNVTTVTVTAGSVKVPTVVGIGQFANLPAPVQESFTKTCYKKRCGTARGQDATDDFIANNPMTQRQVIQSPSAYSPEAFEQIKLWSEYVGNKAVAMPSLWSVRTLSDDEMKNAPKCIKNGVGVTGIVATNASAYSEGPPSFNKEESTLNYKVAAMHYEKDGVTPFVGKYSLVLRSDIAECLYGITASSARSTIDVRGEEGEAKTASSSFTLANGWFTFSASGFGHSAPTVKVKLTGKKLNAVKKGSVTSRTTLLKISQATYVSTSKWSIRVSTPKICKVSGTGIKNLAKGTCKMVVSITPKASKTVSKPKTTNTKVSLIVS